MITYSLEVLHHFTCGECKKWWSIGDHQLSQVRKHDDQMHCPYCGIKQPYKENTFKLDDILVPR